MKIDTATTLAVTRETAPQRPNAGKAVERAGQASKESEARANLAHERALLADTETAPEPQATRVKLSVDDELHRVVAHVVDSESGEVVREIPPEELLKLAKVLRAFLVDRSV